MSRVLLVRHATNDSNGRRLAGLTPGVHINEEQDLVHCWQIAPASVSILDLASWGARLVSVNDTAGAAGP